MDGISLSYGSFPNRKHIYTLSAETGTENCHSFMPSFVSYNYQCLNVKSVGSPSCTARSCTINFYHYFGSPSTEDIEMRVCRDQYRSDEDIVIEDLEIYVQ